MANETGFSHRNLKDKKICNETFSFLRLYSPVWMDWEQQQHKKMITDNE